MVLAVLAFSVVSVGVVLWGFSPPVFGRFEAHLAVRSSDSRTLALCRENKADIDVLFASFRVFASCATLLSCIGWEEFSHL